MLAKISVTRKEEKVVIEFPEGEKTYTLRELNGKERDQYTSLLSSKMRFDNNGKPTGMKDVSGLQVGLLELSLVGSVDLLERGHFLDAGCAGGSEEVHDHGRAAQGGEAHLLAVEGGEDQVGRIVARAVLRFERDRDVGAGRLVVQHRPYSPQRSDPQSVPCNKSDRQRP